jgi:hypothetical protein
MLNAVSQLGRSNHRLDHAFMQILHVSATLDLHEVNMMILFHGSNIEPVGTVHLKICYLKHFGVC